MQKIKEVQTGPGTTSMLTPTANISEPFQWTYSCGDAKHGPYGNCYNKLEVFLLEMSDKYSSSEEIKNNKQSSQKTILWHTMCREYDRSTTTIIHWESCTKSKSSSTWPTKLMLHVATARGNQEDHQTRTTHQLSCLWGCKLKKLEVFLTRNVQKYQYIKSRRKEINWSSQKKFTQRHTMRQTLQIRSPVEGFQQN